MARCAITLAVAQVGMSLVVAASCFGQVETILLSGQEIVDPHSGTVLTFSSFEAPLVNDAGQIVFVGQTDGGGEAVVVHDPAAPEPMHLQILARSGGTTPDPPTAGPLRRYGSFARLHLTQSDRLAFEATLGRSTDRGIFLGAGPAPLFRIEQVRVGSEAIDEPGVTTYATVHLRGLSGHEGVLTRVLFSGSLSTPAGPTGTSGLFMNFNALFPGSRTLALEGDEFPLESGIYFNNLSAGTPVLNTEGIAAFTATFRSETSSYAGSGIFVGSNRGDIRPVAREGDPAPGGGTLHALHGNRLEFNGTGQVVFRSSTGFPNSGIFLASREEPLVALARSEQPAPDAEGAEDGQFGSFASLFALNDSGQLAFRADTMVGTSRGPDNASGIFRSDGAEVIQIAREGQRVSELAAGEFAGMNAIQSQISINNHGLVAFYAFMRGTVGGDHDDEGIFVSNGSTMNVVAQEGASLAGSEVALRGINEDSLRRGGLNDRGQVAFVARLTTGERGVFLYTPILGSAGGRSGAWDDPGFWSHGSRPSAVHRVRLNVRERLQLDGPSQQTTIRSLQLGVAAEAEAVLTLREGPLVLVEDLDIGPHGALELSADLLQVGGKAVNAGELVNHGRQFVVRGETINTKRGHVSGHGHFIWPAGMTNDGKMTFDGPSAVFGRLSHHGQIVSPNPDARLAFQHLVTADGSFQGPGTVAFAAGLRPGSTTDATCSIEFGGDVEFGPHSELHLDLEGTNPGQFDAVVAAQSACLGGALIVRLGDKYQPAVGQQFEIIRAGSIRGGFQHVKLPALPQPLELRLSGSPGRLSLKVVEARSPGKTS